MLLTATIAVACTSKIKNDFNLEGTLIPADEIFSGGSPKDGIPAIDNPQFMPADQVDYPGTHDAVLGIVRNGVAKKPIRPIFSTGMKLSTMSSTANQLSLIWVTPSGKNGS